MSFGAPQEGSQFENKIDNVHYLKNWSTLQEKGDWMQKLALTVDQFTTHKKD